jgi:hypothetical protein
MGSMKPPEWLNKWQTVQAIKAVINRTIKLIHWYRKNKFLNQHIWLPKARSLLSSVQRHYWPSPSLHLRKIRKAAFSYTPPSSQKTNLADHYSHGPRSIHPIPLILPRSGVLCIGHEQFFHAHFSFLPHRPPSAAFADSSFIHLGQFNDSLGNIAGSDDPLKCEFQCDVCAVLFSEPDTEELLRIMNRSWDNLYSGGRLPELTPRRDEISLERG